jgi:hypothetical protein
MSEKSYVTKEQIEKAREPTLYEYLRSYEPSELVRNGASEYRLKSNHSVTISAGNHKWYDHATGEGGLSALDFFIKSRGIGFVDAVQMLSGSDPNRAVYTSQQPRKTKKQMPEPTSPQLPEPNLDEYGKPDNRRAFAYLRGRGIDPEIINHHIKRGALYQENKHANAVFVGFDTNGEVRYAVQRGTLTGRRFVGEVKGSDKRYAFSDVGSKTDTLFVFESAIDAMSAQTLIKLKERNWREPGMLSLGGAAVSAERLPAPLYRFLEDNKDVKKIFLALDNDTAGIDAAGKLKAELEKRGYEAVLRVPKEKDINDELRVALAAKNPKRERQTADAPVR